MLVRAMRAHRLVVLIAASAITGTVNAAPITNQAKVLRIIEGKEVFINATPAQVNQTASSGSLVSTKKSRAELLFDRRAIGLLGRESVIRIGARCFTLDAGVIVINGTQRACLGSKVLGIEGTTYVLAKANDDTYTLSVLAGESVVADELPADDPMYNILSRYPKTGPWLGVQSGGFGSVYPSGGGNFTGGITYYAPLAQNASRSLLYSSTSFGSSFQSLWGVGTELGYRWFSASNESTSGLYVGYAGYGAPGCYSNLVNAGAQWERRRWRLGASGGIKVNSCFAGFSYGALNLSIPVATAKEEPLYFSFSPYVLSGNVVGTGLLSATSSSYFPGVRLSIEVPIGQSFAVRGYAGADTVFGVNSGAFLTYRIPTANGFSQDPNTPKGPIVKGTPTANLNDFNKPLTVDTSAYQIASLPPSAKPDQATDALPGLQAPASLQAQGLSKTTIPAGQRGIFSASGEMIRIEPIPNKDFLELILGNMKGQNPLPESRRIAKEARSRGLFSAQLAGIFGTDFALNASYPVSATVDTPFSPTTQIPAARYVCAATSQARALGAEQAKPGQFDYSGGAVYFGKGSQTSQGYPATYNKSDAYVFSDPGVCKELNRVANVGYDIVQAEKI